MGKEATCRIVADGRAWDGKALLETDELILRGGPARIVLPRATMARVESLEGELRFVAEGRAYSLALGKAADAWAKEILHPKTRIEKLGVKAGQRVALVDVGDGGLPGELAAVGATLASAAAKDVDALFLQVDAPAGLSKVAPAAKRIARNGAVWALAARRGRPEGHRRHGCGEGGRPGRRQGGALLRNTQRKQVRRAQDQALTRKRHKRPESAHPRRHAHGRDRPPWAAMKTLRFQLAVIDAADAEDYLGLVTGVPGVVAALVDAPNATLDVVVSSTACGLLVREEVRHALLAAEA